MDHITWVTNVNYIFSIIWLVQRFHDCLYSCLLENIHQGIETVALIICSIKMIDCDSIVVKRMLKISISWCQCLKEMGVFMLSAFYIHF